jgi:hypothetical protein
MAGGEGTLAIDDPNELGRRKKFVASGFAPHTVPQLYEPGRMAT